MKYLTPDQWESLKEILGSLGVKPTTNVIHAGDATNPTGVMVRVGMNEKFHVLFDVEPKRGRKH